MCLDKQFHGSLQFLLLTAKAVLR